MNAPSTILLLSLLLNVSPDPACGATRCDTPLRLDAVQQSTATGLAQAEEKFRSCTQARSSVSWQDQWKVQSSKPTTSLASARGGSRLKRPSDVSSIINRRRADNAMSSTPASSTAKSESPAWGAAREDTMRTTPSSSTSARARRPAWSPGKDQSTPYLSTMRASQTMISTPNALRPRADDGETMQESPMLLSSTKSDSAQDHSLSAQATPACYSQTRPSSFAPLSKSELASAGANTPHLRASDWPVALPESATKHDPLSRGLFPTEPGSAVKFLSEIKESEAQQRSGEQMWLSQYEAEACMLLSCAREELQMLNERWKESEDARQKQTRQAAGLRVELEILQEKIEFLEAEKVSIYNELSLSKDVVAGLQDEVLAAKQQQREAQQACTVVVSEKASVEAQLVAWERNSLQDVLQGNDVAQQSGLDEKLQDVTSRLVEAQDERQKLWSRIAEMQKDAGDAEQIQGAQRQQLAALCDALELSEREREQLQAKAVRAEQRLQLLLADMHDVNNVTSLAASTELAMEQLVVQAQAESKQTRTELVAKAAQCRDLEAQVEMLTRSAGEIEQVEIAKKAMEQKIDHMERAHKISISTFENELGTWRSKVQDLESQLLQAHDQHRTVSADTEQRMRDLEARVQQQAEDRVRQLEAAGTAKLEEMSAKMQEEVMSKRQEWEERESQARAAHEQVQANLAEKERMAEEFGKKVQQLENALTTVQKQLADTTLHHDQIRQQLDASLARNEQQQANLQEQEMQIETLRERAGALEMKCAGLEKEKACLEQQQLDYKATVATQAEQVKDNEALKEKLAQVQIELTCVESEKTKLEREMQAKISGAQDVGAKLDAAAAESAALMRRCEELRVAFETTAASKRDVEEQILHFKSQMVQSEEAVARKDSEILALANRARELEAKCQEQAEFAEEQMQKINVLQQQCDEARERSAEAANRCKEAEKIARDATRSASKELHLVQAQASHLRQQVDTLTKDKESAIKDKNAALKEKQALLISNMQRDDELTRLTEQIRALQLQQSADDVTSNRRGWVTDLVKAGGGTGEGDVARSGGVGTGGNGEDILQSVIAQRTRRRTFLDSATKTEEAEAVNVLAGAGRHGAGSIWGGGGDGAVAVTHGEAECTQSGIAGRTRGRTSLAPQESCYVLRHIPVPGIQVDIPDKVILSHTGFIIGRLGADLSLTSGYVSRKHAQLQRTAAGWRVLDTSTNGLCVNNVKVKSQQLQDGDILLFEVPQTVGFGQEVPKTWEEKSHFRFRFSVETYAP